MHTPPAPFTASGRDTPRLSLPPEEALLLICARRELTEPLLKEAHALAQEVDWDRVVELSLAHRVAPIVFASMKRHLSAVIPDRCLVRLKQHVIASTHGNLALLSELLRTARELTAGKIRFAVFKGLVINQSVYQDLAIRQCGDIDILVDQDNFTRARSLLISAGFEPTLTAAEELQCQQSGLWHDQRRVTIDLHWGISPRELGIRADRMLKSLTTISISGQSLPSFNPVDQLIILCVNATKEYWNQLLYPYCDIHEHLRSQSMPDWEDVFRRARELRCERMVRTALLITARLYEMAPIFPPAMHPGVSQAERASKELLHQMFDQNPGDSRPISHTRHLYVFQSTDDYFTALMDTLQQRLAYRLIQLPLRRHIPEALGVDDTRLAPALSFLRPVVRVGRILGLILRRAYGRLVKRA